MSADPFAPNEKFTIVIHREAMEEIPEHLRQHMEGWMTWRCRSKNTRFERFEMPLTDSRMLTGNFPPEVIDLLCAIRVGHTKKVEEILTKEY